MWTKLGIPSLGGAFVEGPEDSHLAECGCSSRCRPPESLGEAFVAGRETQRSSGWVFEMASNYIATMGRCASCPPSEIS